MKEERMNTIEKVTKSSTPSWAKGGPVDGMAPKTGSNTQTCGTTGRHPGGVGNHFAAGGSGPMHSKTPAVTRKPGGTGGESG